jgi:hypothetical protein
MRLTTTLARTEWSGSMLRENEAALFRRQPQLRARAGILREADDPCAIAVDRFDKAYEVARMVRPNGYITTHFERD